MRILAIETSTLTGSVALLSDGDLLGEITLSVSAQHSERLMPAIQRLLEDTLSPPLMVRGGQGGIREIDLIAVATGPGSFTGLRIGIAAAQGLALAQGKPVIGIPTLEGLAMNGLFFPGLIVPILDAFRGEVYRGLYQMVPGTFCSLRPAGEDRASGIPDLIAELRSREEEILLLGNGVEKFGDEIVRGLQGKAIAAPPPLHQPRATNIASMAALKYQGGAKAGLPIPNYLRRAG